MVRNKFNNHINFHGRDCSNNCVLLTLSNEKKKRPDY